MISEVLSSSRGKSGVVRVLLRFDTPLYRYPNFGVWCYLIRNHDGIIVFDPGPRYVSLFGYPMFKRETGNTQRILAALDTYFPGVPVAYIAASHYHFDHTENAPHLAAALSARGQALPTLRLHAREWEKKLFLHIIPTSLVDVLQRSGNDEWIQGSPIVDGERIEGTSMVYRLFPGHTSGNIGIVDDKHRIVIGGYWGMGKSAVRISPFVGRVTQFTDECPARYTKTRRILRTCAGYRLYTYHPLPRYSDPFAIYTIAAV